MSQNLPPPVGLLDNTEMQVQEVIFGHRFYADQDPFMIVLETLAVCESKPLGSLLPELNSHESFDYRLRHNRKLRFLLFADRSLEDIICNQEIAADRKWKYWKDLVNRQYQQIADPEQDEFHYLDKNFSEDLDALHQAVRLLRSQEMDVINNRRWTSRFIAPSGPATVCPDMREDMRGEWSIDRRFFGRGGELVYLMLNRSSLAKDVQSLVQSKFFNTYSPINRIAEKLGDSAQDKSSRTDIGYLPVKSMPRFDFLAEDWKSVLSLELPESHLFEPLFRVTALNVINYVAERTHLTLGDVKVDPIIVDAMSGADKQLRESAKQHLNRMRENTNRAIRTFINESVDKDSSWARAKEMRDVNGAKAVLKNLFKYEASDRARTPQGALDEIIDRAISRTSNHPHRYLLPMIKSIGLAHARKGVGTWFGLDDRLLYALVMANVKETMELREFLATLFQKYSLVIGPEEARKAYERLPVGVQSFEANLQAFERRLTRLALTQRLSDDCAFVVNPHYPTTAPGVNP